MSEIGDQASLFDDSSEERPGGASPNPVTLGEAALGAEPTIELTGWFLPTNRHNILKMLAVRAVLPVEAFADKYYDDLLRFTPGRLPLVRGGMPSDLAATVAEEEFDFPILLEIDAEPRDQRSGQHAGDVWCPAGPIPLTMVRRIHFRAADELAEFEQNDYADVRPARDLNLVSPDRFKVARPGPELLEELRSVEPASLAKSIESLDRRAGAILLALLVGREPVAKALIAAMRGAPAPSPAPSPSPSANGVVDWLAGTEQSAVGTASSGGNSAEALITHRILTALEKVDRRDAWRPSEIIEELHKTLPVGLSEIDANIIDGTLTKAAAILRSDEEFTGLRDGGPAALKALLLVLMRPEFERLNPTELEGPGIDEDTRLLAAAMLGAMTGRSRLPVDARPAGLDDLLAHWECDELRVLDNPTTPVPDLRVERVDGSPWLIAGSVKVLRIASDEGIREPIPPLPPEKTADESDVAGALEKILAVDVARSEAIRIAIEHEWWAAIVTTVVVNHESTDFAMQVDSRSSLSIRLRGHAEVRQELDDQKFSGLVLEAPDRDVIIARLTDAGVKRRKPRSVKPKA